MGMGTSFARWGAVVALVGLLGCRSESLFQCQSDSQCVLDGNAGTCQDNGYCSFDDTACASGLRYGDSAPPGLAGLCVDLVEEPTGTTTGPVTTGCPQAACSATAAPTATEPPTSGPSSMTAPGDTSDTTSAGETDSLADTTDADGTDSLGDTTSGATTTEPTTTGVVRCPEFVDEFNNGVLDEPPWDVVDSTPPSLSESGETLRFSVVAEGPNFAFVDLPSQSLTEGYAVAHLTSLPQDDVAQFLFRVFGPDGESVELVLTNNNNLDVRVLEASMTSLDLDEETTEIWLEIFGDSGEINFAYSVNGDDFFELHNQVAPFPLDNVDISMMGGSYAVITSPAHEIAVDDFEYCGQPFTRG